MFIIRITYLYTFSPVYTQTVFRDIRTFVLVVLLPISCIMCIMLFKFIEYSSLNGL